MMMIVKIVIDQEDFDNDCIDKGDYFDDYVDNNEMMVIIMLMVMILTKL